MERLDSDHYLFEERDHSVSLLSELYAMYTHCELIDITIDVEHKSFSCHRMVLASVSPYFKAMFTCDLNERKKSTVRMYDVDSGAMESLIDYAYTGKIIISKDNAQNLLAAASLLQVEPVLYACARFMETQLDISNCIGIYYYASLHDCHQLRSKAKEYVDKYFRKVCLTDEFLSLSHEKVSEILASNELNVEKEEDVFETMISWIQYDKKERSQYADYLLRSVRLGLLNPKYIEEYVAIHPFITSCGISDQLHEQIKVFESSPENYDGDFNFSVCLRSGMIKPEHCILFVGGVDQGSLRINCYNPKTRESYYMCDICGEEGKEDFFEVEDPACIVTDSNEIFVAGGNYIFTKDFDDGASQSTYEEIEEEIVKKNLFQYDNEHDVWIQKASMLFPRSNFSLAYTEGKIYSFGGLTLNQHPTELVECYDIREDKWSYIGMMPNDGIVDLSTVVHNGIIYVLGGRTGVGAHNVVMKFNPKTKEWTSLAGMPTPRFNFGCCVINGEIYVAGGQIYSHSSHTINREALNSVEIYNIQNNQWRQGPDLKEDMYNVGLFKVDGSLYACGTTEYHRSMYRIFRYNVVYKLVGGRSMEWQQIESNLCHLRDFCCVTAKMHTRKLSQVFRPEVDT